MRTYVIDASVAAKWSLAESGWEPARALISDRIHLMAPDLFLAELGNIFWKYFMGKHLNRDEFELIMESMRSAAVALIPARYLVAPAAAIAAETGRSCYDSLYLALAARFDCPLVTADARLVNGLARTRFARLVVPLTSAV